MRKIELKDYFSQRFPVSHNGALLDMHFMYNTLNDYWSLTVSVDDEPCPRMAGKRLIPGFDLLYGYGFQDFDLELWMIETNDGFATNWFQRLTVAPRGAIIVLMTAQERIELIERLSAESIQC